MHSCCSELDSRTSQYGVYSCTLTDSFLSKSLSQLSRSTRYHGPALKGPGDEAMSGDAVCVSANLEADSSDYEGINGKTLQSIIIDRHDDIIIGSPVHAHGSDQGMQGRSRASSQ